MLIRVLSTPLSVLWFIGQSRFIFRRGEVRWHLQIQGGGVVTSSVVHGERLQVGVVTRNVIHGKGRQAGALLLNYQR